MTSSSLDNPAADPLAVTYLGLGSNLGNKEKTIRNAIESLRTLVDVTAVSSIYETAPVGFANQPSFLNACVEGRTKLSPHELLAFVKGIEQAAGRMPNFRNGPRTLDIDILLYAQAGGDQITLESEELTIPHLRMHERGFVLVPLTEIVPDLIHPGSGRAIRSLLDAVTSVGVELWRGNA